MFSEQVKTMSTQDVLDMTRRTGHAIRILQARRQTCRQELSRRMYGRNQANARHVFAGNKSDDCE